MSAVAWGIGCVITVVCLAQALAWRRAYAANAALAKRASLPGVPRDAVLVYMERLFRTSQPVALAAKVDRAYRMPSGLIVLVEFKTRLLNQPVFSDVIQLSAQRVAVIGQTGQRVASYGYVMVKAPAKQAPPVAHRVTLMSEAQVVALVRRREELLAGSRSPRRARTESTCRTCARRRQCQQTML